MAMFVGVDWSRDGTYTGPGDDVTLRARDGVSCSYGRDQSTALSPVIAGRGTLTLDNTSRAYSPRNTASPLYGQVKPARPVLITRTVFGTTYTLFTAHTDDSPINPDIAAKTVTLSLLDSLADFRGQNLSTPLYAGLRTGEAIGRVLDAAGWTGGRDLDAGATVIAWWWLDGTDALTALQDLVSSEGAPALLTVGSSGQIVFRDRHHRLTRAASTTSQGTWRGSGTEPVMGVPFTADEPRRNVVNTASVDVAVRVPTSLDVVWTSTAVLDLADGETKPVTATAADPFYAAVVPDPTDMILAFGTVDTALTRDSGGATTILLTATGGPARVTALQLRAVSVPVLSTTRVQVSDPDSIVDYRPRSYPVSMPWAGVHDTRAILQAALAQRAQPLPVLSVRFPAVGSNAARAAAVLSRNLSDRVTVVEPETGISGDFFIESIQHDMTSELDHTVTFGLEAAPSQPANVFILGSATRGVLGTNRLGKQGLDDPATVFILGSGVLGTHLLAH